jgi:hypothetical protein
MMSEENQVNLMESVVHRETTLNVNFVTADEIGVTYDMMPGTKPADTGAVVAIWQDQNQVPWDNTPLATQPVGTQQHGSLSFTGLSVQSNSYVIGLTVGPMKADPQKARNVAASAYIPDPNNPAALARDFLTLKFVGPTSVAVQFSALAGYRALTDLAWVGIWRGEAVPPVAKPDGASQVKVDSNFGTVSINGISIGVGLTYTVGFFTSGWSDDPALRNQKVLACSLTFTQGQVARGHAVPR